MKVKNRIYYIGTSGWQYDHWQGNFYPNGLGKSKWLEYYSSHFTTVELNNSFYQLPSEKAFTNWRDSSPAEFIFSVKASRFITHIKRIKNTAEAINNFSSRVKLLEKKQGPILYQLPHNMKRDEFLLEDFITTIPKDICYVFEFRHISWFTDTIFDLLHKYNAGLCIYDMPGFSTPIMATSDFAYIRFHGKQWLYGSCYSAKDLEGWAREITELKVGKVFVYFNNDASGFAIKNALELKVILKI